MTPQTSFRFTKRARLDRWRPLLESVRPTDPRDAPDPTISPAYAEIQHNALLSAYSPRYPGDTGRVSCPLIWYVRRFSL